MSQFIKVTTKTKDVLWLNSITISSFSGSETGTVLTNIDGSKITVTETPTNIVHQLNIENIIR